MYGIVNRRGDWWSNVTGWGGRAGRDTFTEQESKTLSLPIGGRWVIVSNAFS